MVKLGELWERTSAKGARYFSGFLGDAQLLLFDAGEREHPTRPGETVRVWKLMAQERDPSRRPAARGRSPQQGSGPHPHAGRRAPARADELELDDDIPF